MSAARVLIVATGKIGATGPAGDDGAAGAQGPAGAAGDWATPLLIKSVSASTYTIATGDIGYTIRFTNAAGCTVTIPTDASNDLVDGFYCTLYVEGAGGLTLSSSGITFAGPTPLSTANQGDAIQLAKTSTANTWLYFGGGLDAELLAIAGLTSAADRVPYFTGSGTASLATFTTFGRSLVDDADAAAARVTVGVQETIGVVVGDETTAITSGTAKKTFRMPFALTATAVRASLTTASSSGLVTVDINEGGTTILSTKLTIDANEKTSTTAATAAVISDTALADDAEITIDIDGAGTGAAGLKVYIIGVRP